MIAVVAVCGPYAAEAARARYGQPVPDPAGILDLPPGFKYTIVARTGDEMSDGLRVPALPDGMGAFRGPGGTTIVVCNHEATFPRQGPFGVDGTGLSRIDPALVFDAGHGAPPGGGATTFVWDTRSQSLVRHDLTLAGTVFNCSGGTTPWGAWLSVEEKTFGTGWRDEKGEVRMERDHGWVFEVPARADGGMVKPEPLVALGRFAHESLVHDDRTGIVYQTEDLHDGLFYRFVPTLKGDLRAGGRLQALALVNGARESCNCATDAPKIRVGEPMKVKWIDMDRVDSPEDDLRVRGYDLGACRFDRGEGMVAREGWVYFTCTSGGAARAGQIWRYRPSAREGGRGEARDPGTLELFYEVQDTTTLVNPDNITVMPSGDLLVCEDPDFGPFSRLITLSQAREVRTFAAARVRGELSGAVYSPDRSTLFVNLQKAGITLAVTGPWQR